MVKKYKEPLQPSHYKLALDCHHTPIFSPEQLKNARVETKWGGRSYEDWVVCPDCAAHKPGSCEQGNIIHRVLFASPMFSRQFQQQQQQPQEQPSQQEEQQVY